MFRTRDWLTPGTALLALFAAFAAFVAWPATAESPVAATLRRKARLLGH